MENVSDLGYPYKFATFIFGKDHCKEKIFLYTRFSDTEMSVARILVSSMTDP
jgi:hypothetical protein